MSILFFILALGSLVLLIIGLTKPAMLQKIFKEPLSKKKMWWLFGSLTIALFLLSAAFSNSTPTTQTIPVAPKPAQEEMDLNIGRSVTEKNMPGTFVLTIKNLNSFKWEECQLTINDDYKHNVDALFLPSELKTPEDQIDYMTLPVTAFTKSDGTRFNPAQQSVLGVCAICEKPYSKVYCGSFNR